MSFSLKSSQSHTHTHTHTHTRTCSQSFTWGPRGSAPDIVQTCSLGDSPYRPGHVPPPLPDLFKLVHLRTHSRPHQACSNLLPPANEVCYGNVFTGVCLSTAGGVHGGGMHGRGPAWQGSVGRVRGRRDATAAGGTHPTGMHSCSLCSLYIYQQAGVSCSLNTFTQSDDSTKHSEGIR